MYYIEKENKILFVDEDRDKLVTTLAFQPNLSEDDIKEVPEGYTVKDFQLITIEEAESKQKQAERERLDGLFMTRGDVFEAFILAKGFSKASLRQMIEQAELDEITKALYLNRFDEALNFYRGFPVFDLLGTTLGITSDMLDKFFDTKDYHYLSTYTLEIQPSPSEAVITINGEITNKVTLPYNTEVEYIVSLDNYVTETGKLNLTEDKVIEIELQSETSITQE